MSKQVIFEDSFLISGIMCHDGCGKSLEKSLKKCLKDLKRKSKVPQKAQLTIHSKPQGFGLHQFILTIESKEQRDEVDEAYIYQALKGSIEDIGFGIIVNTAKEAQSDKQDWMNIGINGMVILILLTLYFIFPPSLMLTIGLSTLSILTSLFTARNYLFDLIKNFRQQSLANMTTTISLGLLLSIAHTLFHAITMPLTGGFSMIFMSYIMPLILIAAVNGMEALKKRLLNRSKKLQLDSTKSLFPEMAEDYDCFQLSLEDQCIFDQWIEEGNRAAIFSRMESYREEQLKEKAKDKNRLKKGMLIKVNPGHCFPIDGILMEGDTYVDASLLTGETQQRKKRGDFIPAGAINLHKPVLIYSTETIYNSTINRLLFVSNREKKAVSPKTPILFGYLYPFLILTAMGLSLLIPFSLGLFTIPLLLQNMMGILFSVCPCTIAIAHEMPQLFSIYRRSQKGILSRDADVGRQTNDMHTLIFDKTGTLTTGVSQVESFDGLSIETFERVYLLEKQYAKDHPLAKTIIHYYETEIQRPILIHDICPDVVYDKKNRGFSSTVQGREVSIGSYSYLRDLGITLPPRDKKKAKLGYTPICVAEDKQYKGTIWVKHELRQGVLQTLKRLKKENKRLIMLTGDSKEAAMGFNKQLNDIFPEVVAEKSPDEKSDFLVSLMQKETNPKGIWFIGDGLNDAPSARAVSDHGGVSCAITSKDKAAYFSDLSFNGRLDYLFAHKKLNQFLNKSLFQNQGLLVLGTLTFLTFMITFSVMGLPLSPLISLFIMVFTTFCTLFNSYRNELAVDCSLDKKVSMVKTFLASDLSIGLVVGGGCLLAVSVLITVVTTSGFILPILSFTAGIAMACSSAALLSSSILFGLFVLSLVGHFLENCFNPKEALIETIESQDDCEMAKFSEKEEENRDDFLFPSSSNLWSKGQNKAGVSSEEVSLSSSIRL